MKISLTSVALFFCFSFSTIQLLAQDSASHNSLTPAEMKAGWQLLFDGKTTSGWHLYNDGNIKSAWAVLNGELVCDPNTEKVQRGDLVSDQNFKDYDFRFEWKISEAGNSGVFINVQEGTEFPTAWVTGPEYQLLDNANMPKDYLKDGKHAAGCVYSLSPLLHEVQPKPFGQWNSSRIVQQNAVITFWLNGIETGHEDMKTERWKQLIAGSKLGNFPSFGKAFQGKIAFQDWSKGIALRNIKIKEIKN
jgi:hypothetical protein